RSISAREGKGPAYDTPALHISDLADHAPKQTGSGDPWTSETSVPWSMFAWFVGDVLIVRPGMVRETVEVALADDTLKGSSTLMAPQLNWLALLVRAVAPLPDHVAVTVSGRGIAPPGGGPPPGLPVTKDPSGTAKPAPAATGSVIVTLTRALCVSLPTTKAESGMMKHPEPNVSPL